MVQGVEWGLVPSAEHVWGERSLFTQVSEATAAQWRLGERCDVEGAAGRLAGTPGDRALPGVRTQDGQAGCTGRLGRGSPHEATAVNVAGGPWGSRELGPVL